MHIWLLSPFSPLPEPGAHESRTAALARHLTRAGHQVVWFSMDWDHRQKKRRSSADPAVKVDLERSSADPAVKVDLERSSADPAVKVDLKRSSADPAVKVDLERSSADPAVKVDLERSSADPAVNETATTPAQSAVLKTNGFTAGAAELGHFTAGAAELRLIPVPAYKKNISLRRFLSHRVWGNRLVRTATRLVASGDLAPPDLILASSPPLDAPRAAFQLRKRFGCKVKLDLTDLWPHTFERVFKRSEVRGQRSGGRHLLLLPLYQAAHAQWRQADGVSAMSREYLDQVLAIAPDQNTHLCYIGSSAAHAVKTSPFYHRGDGTTNFLYLGALTDSYDFDTLFAAARILADEGVPFHIHIAGSGPEEETWKAESGKRKLTQRVTFHGYLNQTEMLELCARCQVGLNIVRPGLHITMPHKLNDYLCAGLPVVNSLRGEAEALLDRYRAGITYHAGDPGSLADAMRSFLRPEKPFTAGGRGTTDKKNAPRNGALKLAEELLDREKTYPEWVEWMTRG